MGINPETGYGVPLFDAAFPLDQLSPSVVYVAPVLVTWTDPTDTNRYHTFKAAAKLGLSEGTGGAFTVASVYGMDPYHPAVQAQYPELNGDPESGVECPPLVNWTSVREIEVDGDGNVYVAAGHASNDNNWLLIFHDSSTSFGHQKAQQDLGVNCSLPGAMLVTPAVPARGIPVRLYLAALGSADGVETRVLRFNVAPDSLTAPLTPAGVAVIHSPEPPCPGGASCVGVMSTVTAVQPAPDGGVYVVGYVAPRFAEEQYLSVEEVFTQPTLAHVAATADWSTMPPVMAQTIAGGDPGSDLALPLSALFVPGEPASPADFDGDADVDLVDFKTFQACFNGPNRSYGAANCEPADFDGDADVDLVDFKTFQACFNGPNRPPKCGS